jgi:hypothetical protein
MNRPTFHLIEKTKQKKQTKKLTIFGSVHEVYFKKYAKKNKELPKRVDSFFLREAIKLTTLDSQHSWFGPPLSFFLRRNNLIPPSTRVVARMGSHRPPTSVCDVHFRNYAHCSQTLLPKQQTVSLVVEQGKFTRNGKWYNVHGVRGPSTCVRFCVRIVVRFLARFANKGFRISIILWTPIATASQHIMKNRLNIKLQTT